MAIDNTTLLGIHDPSRLAMRLRERGSDEAGPQGDAYRALAQFLELSEEIARAIPTGGRSVFAEDYVDAFRQLLDRIATVDPEAIASEAVNEALALAGIALIEVPPRTHAMRMLQEQVTQLLLADGRNLPGNWATQTFMFVDLPRKIIQAETNVALKHARDALGHIDEERGKHLTQVDGWKQELQRWSDRVDGLTKVLKGQTESLSFVGLSQAFAALAKEKQAERNFYGWFTLAFGALLFLVPLAISVGIAKGHLPSGEPEAWGAYVAAELGVFFLLRVALQHYTSAKAQLLQLKHRHSLCAFIEGYATFVADIRKAAGPETLSKFETIVFSGITPQPDNVPSHFDGLDVVTKLLRELKGQKGP